MFQKRVASSPFTLPVVGAIAVVMWLLLRREDVGWQELFLGLATSTVAVYMLAELNNRHVLLRISSRLISSLLAVMLAAVVQLHHFQVGHVVLLFSLASFFPFFFLYQWPSPVLTLIAYLLLSLGSFVFPPILFLLPAYWGGQIYMRGMSSRCFVASLLGLLMPYWFLAGVQFFLGNYDAALLSLSLQEIAGSGGLFADFHIFSGYETLTWVRCVQFGYILLLLVVGIVDFQMQGYLDKTRTRVIYHVLEIHSVVVMFFLLFRAQYFYQFLPLLMVDAAILGGHFLALTYNKFSRIFCIFFLLASLGVLIVSFHA
ncbi:MAG: hypothetical protein IJV06_04010 [Bacteroidaceae bacterium]|nr:hypothetical protein [Bacteroidaceae bacterium]